MKIHRYERGQVLVFIILAVVGMLGFAALAVDVGRVFAERRRAQNAADSAVMAAANAGATITDPVARQSAAETAAEAQLSLNDYVDSNIINANGGGKVEIEVHTPPNSGQYAGVEGYYQVIIYQQVDKVFAQFVFSGLMHFTVEAVSQADRAAGMFDGQAIVATNPTVCNALWFAGTSDTRIRGGDAYSMSSAGWAPGDPPTCTPDVISGAQSCASGSQDGGGNIILDDGHNINVRGPWDYGGSGGVYSVDPLNPSTPSAISPNQCVDSQPLLTLPTPKCDPTHAPPDVNALSGIWTGWDEVIYYPGTYTSRIQFNNPKTRVRFEPGLYCLEQGITMQSGILSGNEVMFYVEHESFNIGADVTVTLQAVTNSPPLGFGAINKDGTVDYNYQWGGMLIYMPYENDGEVHIGGGASSVYSGTIFAPGPRPQPEAQYKCIIEGGGTTMGLAASVICDTIKITGSASLNINYSSETNFHFPPSLSLSQ